MVAAAATEIGDSRWTDDYLWIVVMGCLASLFASFGIGANDVANAFATSVGSRAVTIKQAVILAAIFEFAGAFLLGSNVMNTVRKDIADSTCFQDNPALLMHGMFCALITTGFWLLIASYWKMPVSTTHSIIGAIVGMTMASNDIDCVTWYKEKEDWPYVGGVSGIVLSWVVAPMLSYFFAAALFLTVRTTILRSDNSYNRAFWLYPILVWVTLFVLTLFMIYKGAKSQGWIENLGETEEEQDGYAALIAMVTSLVLVLISMPCGLPFLDRRITAEHECRIRAETDVMVDMNEAKMDQHQIEEQQPLGAADGEVELAPVASAMFSWMASFFNRAPSRPASASQSPRSYTAPELSAGAETTETADSRGNTKSCPREEAQNSEELGQLRQRKNHDGSQDISTEEKDTASKNGMFSRMVAGFAKKQEDVVYKLDDATRAVHDNAEVFDAKTELFFRYIQVFTAACNAFAHGANDVANSVGPLAAIYIVYKTHQVSEESELGADAYWILALGGGGIVLGLGLYGYKIIQVLGTEMAKMTPSRGFAVELGAVAVIIMGTRLGIPLSTTHCQVGATCGVAHAEGRNGINYRSLLVVMLGWVLTLVVAGFTAALLVSLGIYAPSKYGPAYEGMANPIAELYKEEI